MLRLLVAILCCSLQLSAQNRKPSIGNTPGWVTNIKVDYQDHSMDNEAQDGFILLDVEKQVSLEHECSYNRFAERVINETGVQNESKISVSFDPAYQRLILHTIKVVRDNKPINHLDLSRLKVIQEETELDNFIYNGSLSAVMILDDIRPGDIIDYSYSIVGFNPVLNHKYTNVFTTQFSDPILKLYYKLIVPKDRAIHYKNTLETIKPVTTMVNGAQVYEWTKFKIKALDYQEQVPAWYEITPDVMVSEFRSWKEVNDWALQLFPVKMQLSPNVENKAKEIMQSESSEEMRILKALRFVQDDIRYMGIESGVNSHKPASPGKVMAQRFGDCKEKSFLLVSILQYMNIKAEPVLINSAAKNSIYNWLASPYAFDHATVRIRYNQAWHYFDPTISYQRGNISSIYFPDYQVGLPLSDTTANLTPIAFRNNGQTIVKEVFDVRSMSGNGRLQVTTHYSGTYADDTRGDFKSRSNQQILNDYKDFYGKYFSNITADSIQVIDNDSTGVFTTKEFYSIDSMWTMEDGEKRIYFEPFVIESLFKKPKEKRRSMPFLLPFPTRHHETIEVNLPEDWSFQPSQDNINCRAFTYSSKFAGHGSQLQLDYNFEYLQDHVLPAETKEFLAKIEDCQDQMDYYVSYNDQPGKRSDDAQSKSSPSSFPTKPLYTILLIGLLGFSIYKIARNR